MTTMQEFRARGIDMTAPGEDIVPIDVSAADHTPAVPYRTLYLDADGTAGDVKIDTLTGSERVINILAGTYHPVIVKKVYMTGTTAVGLHGVV